MICSMSATVRLAASRRMASRISGGRTSESVAGTVLEAVEVADAWVVVGAWVVGDGSVVGGRDSVVAGACDVVGTVVVIVYDVAVVGSSATGSVSIPPHEASSKTSRAATELDLMTVGRRIRLHGSPAPGPPVLVLTCDIPERENRRDLSDGEESRLRSSGCGAGASSHHPPNGLRRARLVSAVRDGLAGPAH